MLKPVLDIAESIKSMANTSEEVFYNIKKQSFAKICKNEV
jgi:hypothetical protein